MRALLPVVAAVFCVHGALAGGAVTDIRAWVEIAPFSAGSPEMGCANRSSGGEWSVSLDQGRPVVRPYEQSAQEAGEKLPFAPPRPSRFPGDTKFLKTSNGYLVGIDHGEWGGGLWGYSTDGSDRYPLSRENIHGVLAVEGVTVAVAGLAHLEIDQGSVLILREQDRRWRVERSLKLDGAPMAVTRDPKGGIFIVTTSGLSRYSGGAVKNLHASGYGMPYPNSAAVTPDGTVFVGMRHAVARLKPGKGGYSESWLVPPGCASLEVTDDLSPCKCISKPTGAH